MHWKSLNICLTLLAHCQGRSTKYLFTIDVFETLFIISVMIISVYFCLIIIFYYLKEKSIPIFDILLYIYRYGHHIKYKLEFHHT